MRSGAVSSSLLLGVASCWITLGAHAQDTPPSIYFPTTQEENVVNKELRRWSPPRNLWPEQPKETIDDKLKADPQTRVETKYTSDPNVKVKTGEIRGAYTDPEEAFMQQADFDNDRPAELWPSQTVETGGTSTTSSVEYSEKVKYNSTAGASGATYAEPLVATPNRATVEPTTYYVTESEEGLRQRDTIGETSEGLWSEELWDTHRVDSPYDKVPYFFRPLDETLRALTWGPSYDGDHARERYWNPTRFNNTYRYGTEQQINNYYHGAPNYGFGDFFKRRGLSADIGNTYGDRNRFTYEGTAGVGLGITPFTFLSHMDRPLFRVGPLVLTNIELSASVLYTSYEGPALPDDVESEGFISIISLTGNFLLQLTENFYLTAGLSLYYLPNENDWGFAFGNGNGLGAGIGLEPLTFLRANYEFEAFKWDWLAYDEVSVGFDGTSGNAFYNIGLYSTDGGIDRVGRYSFGDDTRHNDANSFDDLENSGDFALNFDNIVYRNSIGIIGTGMVAKDVRGITGLSRDDYWGSDNHDHSGFFQFRFRADYTNPVSRYHPYAEYTAGTDDDFDRIFQTVKIGTTVQITENFSADGYIGYFWTNGNQAQAEDNSDSFIWELGLYHRISQYMSQSLRGGMVYDHDSTFNDDFLSRFIRYGFNVKLGAYTDANLFAQVADVNDLNDSTDDRTSWSAGANLTRKITDHAHARATAYYFENQYDLRERGESQGWIGEVGLNTLFLPRWTLDVLYRYTDQSATFDNDNFKEHLALATITRRF